MKNRPFVYIGIVGLLVIAIAYFMNKIYPDSAPNMKTGFVNLATYFEFIESPVEAESFFGISDYDFNSQAMIKQMQKATKIDFLFAMIYCIFFFLFFKKIAKISNMKWYKTGIILSIMAFFGEFLQNYEQLTILQNLDNGNFKILFVATWIKYISLALGFAIFGLWLIELPISVLHFMGYVSWIPVVLGFLSFLNRGVMTELFTRSINIIFFVAISYCFMFHNDMNE